MSGGWLGGRRGCTTCGVVGAARGVAGAVGRWLVDPRLSRPICGVGSADSVPRACWSRESVWWLVGKSAEELLCVASVVWWCGGW